MNFEPTGKTAPGSALLACLALGLLLSGRALALDVALTLSATSPQPVGTVITLTAAVSNAVNPDDVQIRFEGKKGAANWRVLQDFSPRTGFNWSAIDQDTYLLRAIVVDDAAGQLAYDVKAMGRVSPGVIAAAPVVLPTAHPLVALFSAPPCPAGAQFQVRFWATTDGPPGETTHRKPCQANKGVNHYIAGMRSDTDYAMRGEVIANGNLFPGPVKFFHSGLLTGFVDNIDVDDPPDATTSVNDDVMLLGYTLPRSDGHFVVATDLNGEVIWTYGDQALDTFRFQFGRPLPGGTFLLHITEIDGIARQIMREVDLVGNVVRETNVDAINRQLEIIGEDLVGSFHHEAARLPNGDFVLYGAIERILTDVQGPGDINVYGEMVLVLDPNFNVKWTWNAFEKLDPADVAVLGETCTTGQGGCPPLFLGEPANDWLHMNSIAYSPADGNLILSARHQDAVYKIDYANGLGSGDVLWELGEYGDFTLDPADPLDPWPWFSHQHDAHYEGPYLVLYDNGNTREGALGGQNSRGQVYLLDEVNLFAQQVYNFDLGEYSMALGSAERLSNGNWLFDNGFLGAIMSPTFRALEVLADGSTSWSISGDNTVYRTFRMRSLYVP